MLKSYTHEEQNPEKCNLFCGTAILSSWLRLPNLPSGLGKPAYLMCEQTNLQQSYNKWESWGNYSICLRIYLGTHLQILAVSFF